MVRNISKSEEKPKSQILQCAKVPHVAQETFSSVAGHIRMSWQLLMAGQHPVLFCITALFTLRKYFKHVFFNNQWASQGRHDTLYR